MNPEPVLRYPQSEPPAAGEVREIAPGVLWLRMPLPFALDHINLWLIEDGDGYAIVDGGLGTDSTRALWDRIFAGPLAGRRITRVLVTHCHPDHAGNAAWLTGRFGVKLWMSQADYLTAHAWRDDAAGYSPEALVRFFRENGLGDEGLAAFAHRGNSYRKGVPEFPTTYRRLMDGERVRFGDREWRVIMGYGHAPEHAALYCESAGVLVSGDMVLPRISTNIGVQSVDPDANPLKLFLDSLARYALLPADTLVLPSHGLPFLGLRERVDQLVEHHRLRLAELEEACVVPCAAADVIRTLFRRELDTHQTFFAMGEALAHLNYLAGEGRAVRTVQADGVARFRCPAGAQASAGGES